MSDDATQIRQVFETSGNSYRVETYAAGTFLRIECLGCMVPGPNKFPPSPLRPFVVGVRQIAPRGLVDEKILATEAEQDAFIKEVIAEHESACHLPTSPRCQLCGRVIAVPDAEGHCHAGFEYDDPIDCDGRPVTIDVRDALLASPLRSALAEALGLIEHRVTWSGMPADALKDKIDLARIAELRAKFLGGTKR